MELIVKGDAVAIAKYMKNPAEGIEGLPCVDAVPVVRCRDCKNKGWVQEPCHGKSVDYCRLMETCVRPDDYCSYGERSEVAQ